MKRVLLLTTGGTIGGKASQDFNPVAVAATDYVGDASAELEMVISPTLARLGAEIGEEITITTRAVCDVDSSDMTPALWKELAATIHQQFTDFDAFVITHGTNTLGYTAAALSFALVNPGKPIVLTGSQVPSGMPGSDALLNLQNAIRVAVWRDRYLDRSIPGVTVVFGSNIITGTRVKKDTELTYDAFKSFGVGTLGHIASRINVDASNLAKHVGYLSPETYVRPALDTAALRLRNDFNTEIASITEFPGMSPDIFRALVDGLGIKGFIFRAFGAGDPAAQHEAAFEFLQSREIPIVVTTQAPNGTSNFQINEPGRRLRVRRLAIAAWDMSIEAQTAKLAWLLHQQHDRNNHAVSYEDIEHLMRTDMHGEIGEAWELEA